AQRLDGALRDGLGQTGSEETDTQSRLGRRLRATVGHFERAYGLAAAPVTVSPPNYSVQTRLINDFRAKHPVQDRDGAQRVVPDGEVPGRTFRTGEAAPAELHDVCPVERARVHLDPLNRSEACRPRHEDVDVVGKGRRVTYSEQ